jgi:hypothetical protein
LNRRRNRKKTKFLKSKPGEGSVFCGHHHEERIIQVFTEGIWVSPSHFRENQFWKFFGVEVVDYGGQWWGYHFLKGLMNKNRGLRMDNYSHTGETSTGIGMVSLHIIGDALDDTM